MNDQREHFTPMTVREAVAWAMKDSQPVRDALAAVLAERERELLEIKGPCSNAKCRLHYAHSGPCGDTKGCPGK